MHLITAGRDFIEARFAPLICLGQRLWLSISDELHLRFIDQCAGRIFNDHFQRGARLKEPRKQKQIEQHQRFSNLSALNCGFN